MIRTIVKSLILTSALLAAVSAGAQDAKITGQVRDSISNKPIIYSTVTLYDANDSIITGCISDERGNCEMDKIPYGTYYLKAEGFGYRTKNIGNIRLSPEQKTININILLEQGAQELDAALVTAEKSGIEVRPDKKIVHIDLASTSGGESVADFLKTLAEVTIEGEKVTLKTYAPTILVNGRPAGYAMQDLTKVPASLIASVEVISNPSVRYNPSGLGGIINLKTRKPAAGINGMIQGSGGTNGVANAIATINRKTDKWNLFANLYERYDGVKKDGTYEAKYDNSDMSIKQTHTHVPSINRIYARLGTDFYLDSLNVFTLYWEYSPRRANQKNSTVYSRMLAASQQFSYTSEQDMKMSSDDHQIGFNYTHTLKNKTELTFDVTQDFRNESYAREWMIDTLDGGRLKHVNDLICKTSRNNAEINWSSPLGKFLYIETGLGSNIDDTRLWDYLTQYAGTTGNGEFQHDNMFRLNRMVESAYLNFGLKAGDHWRFMAGVRGEYTAEKLYRGNNRFHNNDYFSFFPGVGLQFLNITLSYSRRIQRPNFLYMSPYELFDYENMYPSHRIVGNPDLQPAYTHSTELSTFSTLPKMRLSLSASYMRTNNDVASTYYYNNDLFYTTYSNVGLTQKYIFNVNLDYHSTPWKVYRPILGLRMSKDIYDSPDTQGNNVHSSYFNYNLSLRNIFTLKNKFYIFFDATYYPVTYYYASKKEDLVDLALYFRKTFGNNFTAMICIYNLLNQNPVSHIYGNGYTAVQSINNHSRSVYLGFMYKFGKPIKTRAKVNLNLNSIETK